LGKDVKDAAYTPGISFEVVGFLLHHFYCHVERCSAPLGQLLPLLEGSSQTLLEIVVLVVVAVVVGNWMR